MKKLFSLLLVATLIFMLPGCDVASLETTTTAPIATMETTTSAETTSAAITTAASIAETTSTTLPITTQATTTTIEETTTEVVAPPVEPEIDSKLEVHFIDVGQADAALILCDGKAMMIDGGNKADSDLIYTYLKKHNVTHLDYMIATHVHEDHVGGLPGALTYATVDTVYCPATSYTTKAFEDFARYVSNRGATIIVPKAGDSFYLGSAKVEILACNADTNDINNTSIVLKITHGDISFLFTGDAEREAEQVILEGSCDLSATVLKVGHHGSESSTTYPFLREILPEVAIISVGKDNSYGHPTEAVLSRLRDADVKVYRTDMQGDIICTSDGETLTVEASKNPDADVFGNIGENSTQQTETTQTETTESTTAETEKQETMVWIPNSGKKYHSKSSCSNMKNPTQVTESVAKNRGYTPCSRCW